MAEQTTLSSCLVSVIFVELVSYHQDQESILIQGYGVSNLLVKM